MSTVGFVASHARDAKCSAEAARRLLDIGEAAFCSIAPETLKRRVSGGDFEALLAGWRTQPRAP